MITNCSGDKYSAEHFSLRDPSLQQRRKEDPMSSDGTVEGRLHTHGGGADATSLFDEWDFEALKRHMNPQEISDGANSTMGDSSSPGSPESSFEQCFPSLGSEFLELDLNAPETPQQCQSMALFPVWDDLLIGASAENSSESEFLSHLIDASTEKPGGSELFPLFNNPFVGASAESCTKEDLFSYRQELSAKKLLAALRNWKGPLRGTWPEHDEAMRIGYVVGEFYNMGGGISFSGPPSNAVHPVPGSDGFGVSVCQTLPKVAGNVCEKYGPGVRIRKVLWWCSHKIPGGMWEWCEKREQYFNNKIALYLFLEPDDGRLMVLENGRFLKTDDNSIAMKPEDDSGNRKNASAGGERKIRKVKRTRT